MVPAARPTESAGRARDRVATCGPADGGGDTAASWPALDAVGSETVELEVGALEAGPDVSVADATTGGTITEISDNAGGDEPRPAGPSAELDAATGAGDGEAEPADAAAAIDVAGFAAAVTGVAFAEGWLVGDGVAKGGGATVNCACKAVVKPCGMTSDGVSVARLDPRDPEDAAPGASASDEDALRFAPTPARPTVWGAGAGAGVETPLSEGTLCNAAGPESWAGTRFPLAGSAGPRCAAAAVAAGARPESFVASTAADDAGSGASVAVAARPEDFWSDTRDAGSGRVWSAERAC